MSADKCPHCGAEKALDSMWGDGELGYKCHTNTEDGQSELCKERAAHAATKRELEKAKADSESWQKQSERFEKQLLETADELAATKRELAQARAECGIAHDQRRDEAHLAMNAMKRANNAEADLELSELSVATLKNRAEVAEARVRELEGLTQNPFAKRAADALAYACATTVKRGLIGSRSSIADALLDYLDVGGVGGPRDVCEWIDAYEKTIGEAMGGAK